MVGMFDSKYISGYKNSDFIIFMISEYSEQKYMDNGLLILEQYFCKMR